MIYLPADCNSVFIIQFSLNLRQNLKTQQAGEAGINVCTVA